MAALAVFMTALFCMRNKYAPLARFQLKVRAALVDESKEKSAFSNRKLLGQSIFNVPRLLQ